MGLNTTIIGELKHESTLTKKILERVPLDKKDWKPHEKSMSLGRLATHIAEIPHWVNEILSHDMYDFASHPYKPRIASSQEELMEIFNTNLEKATIALQQTDDESLQQTWTVKRGEQVLFQTPRKVALRGWALNHLYHHRGQLSVFLRLLDVPIPGMYGPSADERI